MASKVETLKNSVWTLAQIDKAIASIAKRGTALRNDSHECLVQIIEHYIAHGDFTRLPNLIVAVKSSLGSSISQSIYTWVDKYVTGLKFDEDMVKVHKDAHKADSSKPDLMGFVSIPKVPKTIRENVEITEKVNGKDKKVVYASAREVPFFSLERQAPQKPFDLIASFKTLLKRAEAALENNNDPEFEGEKNMVDADMVADLQRTAKRLEKEREARKAQRPVTAAKKSDVEVGSLENVPSETNA